MPLRSQILRHATACLLALVGGWSVALVSSSSFAAGASQEFCEAYALEAVADNAGNLQFHCGNTGPQWSSNGEAHKNWCLAARQDSVEAQAVSRLQVLAKCPAPDMFCQQYAGNAVIANTLRAGLNCPLSGPRWSSVRDSHLPWCHSARQDSVTNEEIARLRDLDNCGRCAAYTASAVGQQMHNNCGFTGARWTATAQQSFSWCLNARPDSAVNETNGRLADMGNCQRCIAYAQQAVNANAQNIQRHCNFTGPAWSSDFNSHRNWCLAARPDSVQNQAGERTTALFANCH
jgi:hypothetical protein